ncbi:MAG: hypothetical protein ABIQ93_15675 [Saprospiraceae bacterium]
MISFLLPACKKEGVGGDATIRGYIKAEKWNSTFTQYIGSYPAKDVDVFIQYDDSYGYDDRTRTDYHGYFEFPFLYKGRYHIYAYSRDSTGRDLSGEVPVIRDIDIRQRMETVDLDTLVIFE